MSAFELANYVEAGLWIAMGIGIMVRGRRGMSVGAVCVVAGTLVVFGVSDVVEASTGAWWRPWWLLVWKGGCVGVLLLAVVNGLRQRVTPRSRVEN